MLGEDDCGMYDLDDVQDKLLKIIETIPELKNKDIEISDGEVNTFNAIFIQLENRMITVIDEDCECDFNVTLFNADDKSIFEDEDEMNDCYVDGCVPSGLDGCVDTIIGFLSADYEEFN